MRFSQFVQNKTTEITVRRGDETISFKWDYDPELMEDWLESFRTVLRWLTFTEEQVREAIPKDDE